MGDERAAERPEAIEADGEGGQEPKRFQSLLALVHDSVGGVWVRGGVLMRAQFPLSSILDPFAARLPLAFVARRNFNKVPSQYQSHVYVCIAKRTNFRWKFGFYCGG